MVERVRNFYGVVKIVRRNQDDPKRMQHGLFQAGIDQGGQYPAPERRMQTICGFDEDSGLGPGPRPSGQAPRGTADAAAYRRDRPRRRHDRRPGREGDTLRYYEINPAVLHLTSRHFTFLKESKAKVDVLLGDARLVLERQLKANEPQNFDVLVLDAFRGASPPMHLMTKEAFNIYLGHLSENGILAVNFELDTFEVAPLHRGMAKQFGLNVRWIETRSDTEECAVPISWALYTRDKSFFDLRPVSRLVSLWRDKGKSGTGVDRPGQQPDEHHQLEPGIAAAANLGPSPDLVCHLERFGLEQLERHLLRQHHVTGDEIAAREEAPAADAPAVLVELVDIHRAAVTDAVAATGLAADHLEEGIPLILLELLAGELLFEQPHAALVRR